MEKVNRLFYYVDEYLLREHFPEAKTKVGAPVGTISSHATTLAYKGSEIVIQPRKEFKAHKIHVNNDTPDGSIAREIRALEDKLSQTLFKVFIVHGHGQDGKERRQLETILKNWNCQPIFVDQQANQGRFIAEKVGQNMAGVQAGIVLATPDDVGGKVTLGSQQKLSCRARQNVVLELGWLLGKLGPSKMILLLRNHPNYPIEIPSDIHGMVYVPFVDDVLEVGQELARELYPMLVGKSEAVKGEKHLGIGE